MGISAFISLILIGAIGAWSEAMITSCISADLITILPDYWSPLRDMVLHI